MSKLRTPPPTWTGTSTAFPMRRMVPTSPPPRPAARSPGRDPRLAAEPAEVGQDGESGPLALLGVELDRHQVPLSHGCGKRYAVRGPAGNNGRGQRLHRIRAEGGRVG